MVAKLELPKIIKASGRADREIAFYHSAHLRNLLNQHAAKIGQSIPTEEEAQLIFVKDALADYNLFIQGDAVFRTVEVFNWDQIRKITDLLAKDPRAILNESLKISRKLGRELPTTDSACSAFALGILSLEEFFIKLCENGDYDFALYRNKLTAQELAAELIHEIAYSLSLKSEDLGEDGEYVTPKNVTQIEKIVADLTLVNSYQLCTFILS